MLWFISALYGATPQLALPTCPERPLRSFRRSSVLVIGILVSLGSLAAAEEEQKTSAPASVAADQAAQADATAAADDDTAGEDSIVSLTAYNVKADRIEDFGLRVSGAPYSSQPNALTFWFAKFVPVITAVVPNTAAAKAGLQPGERILKSEGKATVGGPFSTGKFGQWYKTQKKKWAEVSAGKKDVTWTLEIESPVTKAVRTVTMVVPTPPPRWGASTWRVPQGRAPASVPEPGPLAERCRDVLDNGIWTLVDRPRFAEEIANPAPTGYEWQIDHGPAGYHRICVTQHRGRTEVQIVAGSRASGRWVFTTSPSGALEQARHWRRGSKTGEISLEEARPIFEHELDLWTTKIGKVTPRWPLELKPGYDADAIFAKYAAKNGAPVAEAARPLAPEFLKLPSATAEQQALFAEAYGKIGADQDRWAYTETSRGLEDKRVLVMRVDPSRPEADRCTLLTIDGKTPTAAEVQRWRDDGGDTPKALGEIPPLVNLVDLKDLRVSKDETAAIVFELPIRGGSAEMPAEKFQALFRVNKTHRAFEDIALKLRDSFRVAGVVKIVEAGVEMQFQTIDPALAPQPVRLKAGGGVRVLLVKLSRTFEATRGDFRRVVPFEEMAELVK